MRTNEQISRYKKTDTAKEGGGGKIVKGTEKEESKRGRRKVKEEKMF